MKISKSKINAYKKCPREFKYIYVDNLESEPNQYMQLGLDVHNIAEGVAKELMGKDSISEMDILQAFENNYIESKFDITKHMENLFYFFKNTLLNNRYKIFGVERKIYDEKFNINGIIDIILEDTLDGDLIIIDYKTSKSKPITEYRLELCMYRPLESQYPNRNISSAAIFFTKDGKFRGLNFVEHQKKGAYITEEDYQAVFTYINFVRNKIDKNVFPPKKQFLCQYCNFKNLCDQDGGF